jgi:membrane-bound serine protease (ClpP class)
VRHNLKGLLLATERYQMKLKYVLLLFVFVVGLSVGLQSSAGVVQGSVLIVRVNSEIARPTVELFTRSIEEAKVGGARLIVCELNTPGGELGSVTDIMNALNSSPVPVVVWVTPSGAAAWSGGVYVLMSSHIAAMASGTTIGSAQPVGAFGETLNESKYINALSGILRDNARLHGRNETVAQEFVTQNLNVGPDEALRFHVIEFVADDLQNLLVQLEPYNLVFARSESGAFVWKLVSKDALSGLDYSRSFDFSGISQASEYAYEPSLNIRILEILSNPLIATVLLIVGLYAVIIGFKTPGYGAEIAGGLMVFLALVGFGIIGINIAAALLFILGVVCTLIEIKTHIGVFALGGIAMIVLGSFFAFPLPGWELLSAKAVESARTTLIAVALVMSALFGAVVYKVAEARRMRVKGGPEELIGKTGVAASELAPRGEVKIEGQTWRAETVRDHIKQGEPVEVVSREGLVLRVKPKHPQGEVE